MQTWRWCEFLNWHMINWTEGVPNLSRPESYAKESVSYIIIDAQFLLSPLCTILLQSLCSFCCHHYVLFLFSSLFRVFAVIIMYSFCFHHYVHFLFSSLCTGFVVIIMYSFLSSLCTVFVVIIMYSFCFHHYLEFLLSSLCTVFVFIIMYSLCCHHYVQFCCHHDAQFCYHHAGYSIWRKRDELKLFPELIPILQCRPDLLRHIL